MVPESGYDVPSAWLSSLPSPGWSSSKNIPRNGHVDGLYLDFIQKYAKKSRWNCSSLLGHPTDVLVTEVLSWPFSSQLSNHFTSSVCFSSKPWSAQLQEGRLNSTGLCPRIGSKPNAVPHPFRFNHGTWLHWRWLRWHWWWSWGWESRSDTPSVRSPHPERWKSGGAFNGFLCHQGAVFMEVATPPHKTKTWSWKSKNSKWLDSTGQCNNELQSTNSEAYQLCVFLMETAWISNI